MLNLISAAILMHAGSFDCNDDGIPDQFQTCLDATTTVCLIHAN